MTYWCVHVRAEGSQSNVLLYASVSVVNFTTCYEMLKTHGITVYTSMLCMNTKNNKGTCQGDGGGPVACASGGHNVRRWHRIVGRRLREMYPGRIHVRELLHRHHQCSHQKLCAPTLNTSVCSSFDFVLVCFSARELRMMLLFIGGDIL